MNGSYISLFNYPSYGKIRVKYILIQYQVNSFREIFLTFFIILCPHHFSFTYCQIENEL